MLDLGFEAKDWITLTVSIAALALGVWNNWNANRTEYLIRHYSRIIDAHEDLEPVRKNVESSELLMIQILE